MAEKEKLPIGIEDFENIRKDGFYYVDKTGMIRDLLENMAHVNLFTRPVIHTETGDYEKIEVSGIEEI